MGQIEISDTMKAYGITTMQAEEAANYIAESLNRMPLPDPVEAANAMADLLRRLTPLDLEQEIACIKMNPSLHWWQKVFLIRKLKKQIAERKNQNG